MKSDGTRSFPIRIPERLMTKITQAAELLDMKQQEVMRLAMEIGLEDLARIQHQTASIISEAASQQPDTEDRKRLVKTVRERLARK